MGDRIDFPVSQSALSKRRPCKECGKPIVFVRNEKTKRWMALDCQSAIAQKTEGWYRLEDHHPHCPNWAAKHGTPTRKSKAPAPVDPSTAKRERPMTQAEEERRDLYGPRN